MKKILALSALVVSLSVHAAPLSVAIDYTLKSAGTDGETRNDAVKTELSLEQGRWTPVGGATQKAQSGEAKLKGSLVRLVKSDEKMFELEFLFLESSSLGAPIAIETAPRMIGRYGLPMSITTKTAKGDFELSLKIEAKKAL